MRSHFLSAYAPETTTRLHPKSNSREFPLTTVSLLLEFAFLIRVNFLLSEQIIIHLLWTSFFFLPELHEILGNTESKWLLSSPYFSCMLEFSQGSVNFKSQSPLKFQNQDVLCCHSHGCIFWLLRSMQGMVTMQNIKEYFVVYE